MQKLMKKLHTSQKGFTLVEVIVVLVILAILAAIAIPSLTGYIDKAKAKTDVANARAAMMAVQTLASESYGTAGTVSYSASEVNTLVGTDIYKDASGDSAKEGYFTADFDGTHKAKMTEFEYKGAIKTCTWTPAKGWEVN